jgi:predicted HTH transcriptional regulator
MFNKLLSEITFTDVENFCKEWPEGIRVEYKSQMIDNIPKTISAFANTLGGILVIGVPTDATNKVALPINGIDEKSGLEERITQASVNGIYPGVLPEIRVFNISGTGNKVVIVIKVHESIEAPHAIQNSTRVYIRTGNLSNPYDLAEIDRIEYF